MHVFLSTVALALVPNSGGLVSRIVAQNRAAVVGQKISRSQDVSMALPRVVVTGMGIVSPLGTTLDEVKDALYNCKPGITYCEEFAEVGMKSKVSGMPTFDWCAATADRTRSHTPAQEVARDSHARAADVAQ